MRLVKANFNFTQFLISLLFWSAVLYKAELCQVFDGMICNCAQGRLDCEAFENLNELSISNPEFPITPFKTITLYFKMSDCIIPSRFFQPLNRFLPISRWENEDTSVVTLGFSRFNRLVLFPMAFDGIFDNLYQNLTKLLIDFYNNVPVTVFSDTFRNLKVGTLEIHGSNMQSNESKLSFSSMFNHTSVSKFLRLEGIHLPTIADNGTFLGTINRLQYSIYNKQVNTISASEYPQYPANFYTISAHNARDIDGRSFENYQNLRGLVIHNGNIELNQAKLRGLNYLEELDLNIEQVGNKTLQPIALTLKVLILRNLLKHISPDNLEAFGPGLRTLDIRGIDFEQLSYPSRCAIAELVYRRREDLDVLVNRNGCECHQAFVNMVKGIDPLCAKPNLLDSCTQDAYCEMVRNYFRGVRSPPSTSWYNAEERNNNMRRKLQQVTDDLSQASGVPAIIINVDTQMPLADDGPIESDWINTAQSGTKPSTQYRNQSTLPDDDKTYGQPLIPHRSFSHHMQWIPIVIVCVVLIIALMVALLVWHVNFKRRRRGNFKPIPSDAAT